MKLPKPPGRLVLASSYGHDGLSIGELQAIPRSCVVSIKRLRV